MKVEKLLIGLHEICDDEIFMFVIVGVCTIKCALTAKGLDTSFICTFYLQLVQDEIQEHLCIFTDVSRKNPERGYEAH